MTDAGAIDPATGRPRGETRYVTHRAADFSNEYRQIFGRPPSRQGARGVTDEIDLARSAPRYDRNNAGRRQTDVDTVLTDGRDR